MAVTSYIRRMFKNNVSIADTVPAGFSSGATSFSAADGSSFPDGSIGPFIITADQGLTTEEKILIASRSGAVFTVASNGRGYNGTVASTHAAGASILHTIDAQDMDEANQTMAQTIGAIAAKGDLLIGSAANTLTKLAVGSANQTLQVVSGTLSYVGFGSGRSQNVGASNTDGTDTTYARSDHVHSGVTTFNTRNGVVTLTAADVEAILTAKGQLIAGTGSGTGELLGAGSAGTILNVGGADASGMQWSTPLSLGTPGLILAFTNISSPSYSTSSASYTIVDGTNAKLTFTVPPSGNVLFQMASLFNNGSAGIKGVLAWSNVNTNNTGLISSGVHTGNVDGTSQHLLETEATGLTPGASLTAYLQYAAVGSGTFTINADNLSLKAIAL